MNKRKTVWYWLIAILITLSAAYYQRTTGPTYPKKAKIMINGSEYKVRMIRSLGLDDNSEVKLAIPDTSIQAKLYYKRFQTNDPYIAVDFLYAERPVNSFVMNKVFKMKSEKGFFAQVPQQPPAGKIQYFVEITDSKGTQAYFKENPVVIRYKGTVPAYILAPHILAMFIAMLLSTLAGAMALGKHPRYKFYGNITLVLFIIGGLILGPIVQKFAFGEFWTGIPFGWDLTDNKTLIALFGWIVAVWFNQKEEKPIWTVVAAILLLAVYSIPHSMFGSQLNYESGKVVTGFIQLIF
jgi:hypothetical protein